MNLDECIAGQRARIAELEAALWQGGFNDQLLAPYQAAYRDLEALLARGGPDDRHRFVILIPVADSPVQLGHCLDSLLTLCRAFGYGGMHGGRFRKVSVLLADDSADPANMERQREIARQTQEAGLDVHYFGIAEQRALLDRLQGIDLRGVIGRHGAGLSGRKGQAVMRNIAYLKLAEVAARQPGERPLFYSVDADQRFAVNVATAHGTRSVCAVNFLFELDRVFGEPSLRVLTGKVVGDPPVSPAVMAGNFLDDVIGFVGTMAGSRPGQPYRQPAADPRGSGEAAYHDMAGLFGFGGQPDLYRYRCGLPGVPSNADCFAEFAGRLEGFFHGEHPTRITWYRHRAVADSVQPARTVYAGNYVFTPAALDWFIPFAPLRLRMSGPTMGRILRAELADAFVSANLPMLHGRTLETTGRAEFRPGVVASGAAVDLCDEFERQFFGDVMLFSIERLTGRGYPAQVPPVVEIGSVWDQVCNEMAGRYGERRAAILSRLEHLDRLLRDPAAWWHGDPGLDAASGAFLAFTENISRNFGDGSACDTRIGAARTREAWRRRQLAAIMRLPADRDAWGAALCRLQAGAPG